MLDFIRVAAAVPAVSVGNVTENVQNIVEMAREAAKKRPQIIVFPELSLTGYTCGDLFFQKTLLDAALDGLRTLCEFSRETEAVLAVGLPLSVGGKLFNVAAILHRGSLCGIVPKTYIPNYNEFYEQRWFSSGKELNKTELLPSALGMKNDGKAIPIGTDLIFDTGAFLFGAEICEDLWATVPPSSYLALAGAEVILNLSASNETISKRRYRRSLVSAQSGAQLSAYVYVSSGCTESTTDLIFSGHSLICENGRVLCENENTVDGDYVLFSDIDLGKIRVDRLKIKTFAQSSAENQKAFRTVAVPCILPENDLSCYPVDKLPFVPNAKRDRAERCTEIFEMQVMGLKKRMDITRSRPVVGVSGGLDSTLALLVCAEAARRAGRPLTDVVGITMPCFGTTDRTYRNSLLLMESLGITVLEIPIRDAVRQHFSDIGHDGKTPDLTFENSQARERTQVLMDIANKSGGMVIGTGDLSELALGWATYNGDHMSMYAVNSSVPKTLVRYLVRYEAECAGGDTQRVLEDILATPVSPELLPADKNGEIAQKTEDLVGPYELHDFFLYHMLRFGETPAKIYRLALIAFDGVYSGDIIMQWLKTFIRRFFSQQFKRSCIPDGPKVGSVTLSPRGDWRMPSDASAALWLAELEEIPSPV